MSNFMEKWLAWQKASLVPGYDPLILRQDDCGRPIRWTDYGDRSSEYGWEIDHTIPKALGGPDVPWNRRALNRESNLECAKSVDLVRGLQALESLFGPFQKPEEIDAFLALLDRPLCPTTRDLWRRSD